MLTGIILAIIAAAPPAPRTIEVGAGTTVSVASRRVVTGRTGGPLPIDWAGRGLVVSQGEAVILQAASGRKFKNVTLDREGVVELRPLDPTRVRLTGVNPGLVRMSVETVK